jgi:hypothetical protein
VLRVSLHAQIGRLDVFMQSSRRSLAAKLIKVARTPLKVLLGGFSGVLKWPAVREILRVGERRAGLDVRIKLRLRDIETKRNVKFSQIPSAQGDTTPRIFLSLRVENFNLYIVDS